MRNSALSNSVPRPSSSKTPLRERYMQCKSAQKSKRTVPRTFGFDLRDPLKVAKYVANKEMECKKANTATASISLLDTASPLESVEQSSIISGPGSSTSKTVHFVEDSTTVYFDESFENSKDEIVTCDEQLDPLAKKKVIGRTRRIGSRAFGIDLNDPLSVAQYANERGIKQLSPSRTRLIEKE